MAKVYVSSTVTGLETERKAVIDWLVTAGHRPVHGYVADSESVRDSYLADVDACDLYVLILGHRYGHVPEFDNPERLSIAHLEFRRAGEHGVPRVALVRITVPDVRLSDLLNPETSRRLQDFHAEVRKALRPAEFRDAADVVGALSTAVPRELAKQAHVRDDTPVSRVEASRTTGASPSSYSSGHQSSGSWWATLPGVMTGAAAIITALTGLATLFWPRSGIAPQPEESAPTVARQAPVEQGSRAAPVATTGNALPKVMLGDLDKVSFIKPQSGTYTVLDVKAVRRTAAHYELRIRVRYWNSDNSHTGYLHDGAFRLLVDGVPRAPDSNLHVVVDRNSARDGDVTFEVPVDAKTLVLQVLHRAQEGYVAEIPLRIVRGAPAASR